MFLSCLWFGGAPSEAATRRTGTCPSLFFALWMQVQSKMHSESAGAGASGYTAMALGILDWAGPLVPGPLSQAPPSLQARWAGQARLLKQPAAEGKPLS